MKKGLIFLSLFIVCLLGVLIVAPGFIDWNRHKPTIIEKLHDATGHDYEINGPLEFTILPFPKLLIEGLEISKGDEKLLDLGRLDVQVELMPLISGVVNVKSVSLIKPAIMLNIDKSGEMSWMTSTLKEKLSGKTEVGVTEADDEKDASQLISLGEIKIEDGTFEFVDSRQGTHEIIKNINLDMSAQSLSGPFVVDGSLNARNQRVDLTVNTGRLEKDAQTLSVAADLKLAKLGTSVNYSGVVGVKGTADIQGETTFKTANINELLAGLGFSSVPSLSKPFETTGIFSFANNKAAYRNLTLSYDDIPAGGSFEFLLPQGQNAGKLDVSLRASKTVVLDRLLPKTGAASGGERTEAELGVVKSFLPQTITLPMAVDADIKLAADTVQFDKAVMSGVNVTAVKAGKETKANIAAALTDGGKLALSATLGFASESRTERSGAVTYSDPTISYQLDFEAGSAQALAGLLPESVIKAARPYLAKGVRTQLSGSVQPDKASVTAGKVAVNDTNLAYSGSYAIKGGATGRDLVTVNLSADDFNVDQWTGKSAQAASSGAAGSKSKGAINVSEYTKMLDLPFDLAVTAVSKRSLFGGVPYQDLQLKAATIGKALKIDRLSLADGEDNDALVTGKIDNIVALDGINMSVSGKTGDLEKLLNGFDVDTSGFPARVGAAALVSEFRGKADNLAFTANMKALRGSAEASGTLADMLDTPKISGLTLRLRHPSYVELARLFKPDFKSGVGLKKSLDLFTSMKNDNGVYTFSEIKAIMGPSTLTGEVRADLSGAKPVVKAAIQADVLPLDAFLGIEAGSKGTTRVTPQSAAPTSRWSRKAMDLSALHNFDVDVRATANTLTYGNWRVNNARLDTILNNGVLQLQEVSGDIYDGTLKMTGEVSSGKELKSTVNAKGDIKIDNVQLEPFVQSFSGSKLVKARGPLSLDTNFSTAGISQSDLVNRLQGSGTMTGENLVFEGFDLARLSRALANPGSSFTKNFGSLLDATTSGGTTSFESLDGAFDITNGVININKLDLTGETASVNGNGNVNLPLWTIDLTTNVVLSEPEDAPVLKTVFKGPLDNPANTFGQNALNQYFNKQLEGMVLNPLLDSLQKKGILPSAPEKTTPAPAEGTTEKIQSEPLNPANDNKAPTSDASQIQEQPTTRQEPQEVRPEDVLRGVLGGILQGR